MTRISFALFGLAAIAMWALAADSYLFTHRDGDADDAAGAASAASAIVAAASAPESVAVARPSRLASHDREPVGVGRVVTSGGGVGLGVPSGRAPWSSASSREVAADAIAGESSPWRLDSQGARVPAPSDVAGPQAESASDAVPDDVREPRSKLERVWHSETHDPVQSRHVQSYLQQTARALALPADSVRSTDCGGSVCRVRLSFDSLEAAAEFQQAAQRPDFRYELKSNAPSVTAAAAATNPAAARLGSQGSPDSRGSGTLDPEEHSALVAMATEAAAGRTPSARATGASTPKAPTFELEVLLDYAPDEDGETRAPDEATAP